MDAADDQPNKRVKRDRTARCSSAEVVLTDSSTTEVVLTPPSGKCFAPADYTIRTADGSGVRVHKLFLALQSPFFSDLFEDTATDHTVVEETQYEVAELMKHLYYPATRPVKNEMAIQLTHMAHKYNFPQLMKRFEQHLCSNAFNLTADPGATNVISCQKIVSSKQIPLLMSGRFYKKCVDFAAKNFSTVLKHNADELKSLESGSFPTDMMVQFDKVRSQGGTASPDVLRLRAQVDAAKLDAKLQLMEATLSSIDGARGL